MPTNIPLNVIPEPKEGNRTILFFPESKLPILTGDYGSPNLICGSDSCGAILVVSLPLDQFESTTRNLGDGRSRKQVQAGSQKSQGPVHVAKEVVWVTPNGPLVVLCPICGAFNEFQKSLA